MLPQKYILAPNTTTTSQSSYSRGKHFIQYNNIQIHHSKALNFYISNPANINTLLLWTPSVTINSIPITKTQIHTQSQWGGDFIRDHAPHSPCFSHRTREPWTQTPTCIMLTAHLNKWSHNCFHCQDAFEQHNHFGFALMTGTPIATRLSPLRWNKWQNPLLSATKAQAPYNSSTTLSPDNQISTATSACKHTTEAQVVYGMSPTTYQMAFPDHVYALQITT